MPCCSRNVTTHHQNRMMNEAQMLGRGSRHPQPLQAASMDDVPTLCSLAGSVRDVAECCRTTYIPKFVLVLVFSNCHSLRCEREFWATGAYWNLYRALGDPEALNVNENWVG